MDWEQVREWLSTLGALAIGCGTVWLAYTGNAFRKDKQFEHKFDLAKEAIRIFNHLRNDIQQIRSPYGFEGEINRLKSLPEDNDLINGMKKYTDGGLALLRMDDRGKSLAEMNRLEPEFRAVFGETDAFENMRKIRHEIWVAAHMIVSGGRVKEDRMIIWPSGKDDEINKRMDSALSVIEKICHPVLSGRKKIT